ncbi:MAG: T9SS type A sorting domain-containing protein [Bacteroidetes bacterium]|nr:T9SS type A sorting domain-containing protein [Bacteroidota bacterium]
MLRSFGVFVVFVLCSSVLLAQNAGIFEGGVIVGSSSYTEPSSSSINNAVIIKNAGQQLNLTSAYIKTFKKPGMAEVCSGYLFYRIYNTNSTPPPFSAITCSSLYNLGNSEGLQNQEWFNNSVNIDLISGLLPGDYYLDIYYGATITAGTTGCTDGPSSFIKNLQARVTINPALNATFKGFTASSNNDFVLLQWQMANSDNIQYFTVEKSSNGLQWQSMDTVVANSNLVNYSFIDSLPETGLNIYRIKASDGNKTIYSFSRRTYVGVVNNLVTVYPNPVKQNLRFEMSALSKGKYRASVFSLAGVKIAEQIIDHDGKDKYVTIPLPPAMSRGVYWIVLMTKNEFYKQNFLVQ